MSLYADYQPDARASEARLGAECVRVARTEDVDAITRISAERDGHDPDAIRHRIAGEISGMQAGGSWCVFVAEIDDAVVGYGRIRDLTHAEGGLPTPLPEGWYLTGVVIAPAFRRRGLGAALTEARIDWARERTPDVYYVANLRNRPSQDLHAVYGFEEISRAFDYPRAGLKSGEGAAYRLRLS